MNGPLETQPGCGEQNVTRLLAKWTQGDPSALDCLTPLVYAELKRLAAGHLKRERPGHSVQPTALVHEAYLRLVDQRNQEWSSRSHFFGVASHLMRLILVDHARKRAAQKRRAAEVVTLDDGLAYTPERAGELVALDDALNALAKFDERKARIVELRYFGGLSIEETAQALSVSTATVERDARMAQLWLAREMKGGASP
ncbi:MAG: sigma-70 family RNA polymerase sigma factor [Acidobacteria bacterium]|nr:sigma-70 family RNA polymerase sigma factor [Acidobacteriota bacterium]